MPGIQKLILSDGKRGYIVGASQFRTKGDVTQAVRAILYRYSFGERINLVDHGFILALLQFHRHAALKIGAGVRAFTVEQNPEFPSQRGFWIERLDGTRTDFSFVECISPAPAIRDLKWALRFEIKNQVLAAKNAVFDKSPSVICEVSGETLTRENCHVDHAPPNTFDVIADRFIAECNLNPETIEYTGGDGCIGELIADRGIAGSWQQFHGENATLRVISKMANLSDVKVKFNRDRRAE